jgi:hypothetical protein
MRLEHIVLPHVAIRGRSHVWFCRLTPFARTSPLGTNAPVAVMRPTVWLTGVAILIGACRAPSAVQQELDAPGIPITPMSLLGHLRPSRRPDDGGQFAFDSGKTSIAQTARPFNALLRLRISRWCVEDARKHLKLNPAAT